MKETIASLIGNVLVVVVGGIAVIIGLIMLSLPAFQQAKSLLAPKRVAAAFAESLSGTISLECGARVA